MAHLLLLQNTVLKFAALCLTFFLLTSCGGGGDDSGNTTNPDPNGAFAKPYITFADSTNAGEVTVEWLPARYSSEIAADTEYRIEASLDQDFTNIGASATLTDSQVTLKQLSEDRVWHIRISATKLGQTLVSNPVEVGISGTQTTRSDNNVVETQSSQLDLTPNDENIIELPAGHNFLTQDILVDQETGFAVRINNINDNNQADISHVGLSDIYQDLDFKTSFTLADTAVPNPSFNKNGTAIKRNVRTISSSPAGGTADPFTKSDSTSEDLWKKKGRRYFDGIAYRKLEVRYKTHAVIKTGTSAPVLDLLEVTDYFHEHAVWLKSVKITHPTLGSIDCELCRPVFTPDGSNKLTIFPWRQNTWKDDFYGGSWLSDRPYTVEMTVATCDTKDNEDCVSDENHIEKEFSVKTKLYIISALEEENFKFPTLEVDATFYVDKNDKFQINGFGKLGELVDFSQDANALRKRIQAIKEENSNAERKGKKIVTVRDGLQGLGTLLQRDIKSVDETQQLQDQNLLTFLASKELDSISEKEMDTLDKVVQRYQGKESVQEALKQIVTPVKEIDCATDTDNCKAFLRIAGNMTLDPTVDVGFKMKSGTDGQDFSISNIESTHFALHASPEDFNLKIEAEIGANAQIELGKNGFPAYEIASKRFYRVVFAGPVPIIISGRISMMGEIDLEATFSAQASLKEEYSYEAEFAAGMSFGEPLQDLVSFTCNANNNDPAPLGNSKFYMVGCYNTVGSEFTTTATINGKATGTARFKIYPEVEFMVYRNIGVIGSVEPQVYATAEVEGNVVNEVAVDDNTDISLTTDYHFNRMEVGLAAQTRFRADLGLIYTDHKDPKAKEKVAGLSFPGCGKFICDRNNRKALPSGNVEDLDYPLNWPLFSLPSAAISDNNGYLGLQDHLGLSVTSTPGEKFGSETGNTIEEFNWLAFKGNQLLENIQFEALEDKNDNIWVQVSNPQELEPGAYNFRLIYSSELGSFVRQRKDFFFNYNPPIARTNLQVRAVGGAVSLSWDQTHDIETGEYLIYRDDVHIASVSNTQYIDEDADPSQSYRYQVRPVQGQSIQFDADIFEGIPTEDKAPTPFGASGLLNDTGMRFGGLYPSGNSEQCDGEEITQQDCAQGRDAKDETNPSHDGLGGFSFTKISADGAILPHSAAEWACVFDNVSGLMWEVKHDNTPHEADAKYTWKNSHPLQNGGDSGHSGEAAQCSIGDCNTQNLIQTTNNQSLCGYSDWRLPKVTELQGLATYDQVPAIDSNYFPTSLTERYWSNTVGANNSGHAWAVNFSNGAIELANKTAHYATRLVRSAQETTATAGNESAIIHFDTTDPRLTPSTEYIIYLATESGTAVALEDWDSLAGAQQISGVSWPYTLAFLSNGQTYFVTVVTNTNGEQLRAAEIAVLPQTPPDDALGATGLLNDTGMYFGGDYPSGNNSGCSGEEAKQQDCARGRDANGSSNSHSDGYMGFRLQKLDTNGQALPNEATEWVCVEDLVTGLIWEAKQGRDDVQGNQGLHDADDNYSWYNSDPLLNGGEAGNTADDRATCSEYSPEQSSSFCNTQAYTTRVNSTALCGYGDWRLPTIHELQSLVAYDQVPALDNSRFYFANTNRHWSATPGADNPGHAWQVNFSSGAIQLGNKSDSAWVRLVRGTAGLDLTPRHEAIVANWEPSNPSAVYDLYVATESGNGQPLQDWFDLQGAQIANDVQPPHSIDNLSNGESYYITLVETQNSQQRRSGEQSARPQLTPPTPLGATGLLNDTATRFGGNYPSGNASGCSGEQIEQQDCRQGRDADSAANSDHDGYGGLRLQKLDSDGSPLAADSREWRCTRDLVTGLTWEVKRPAESNQWGAADHVFTWYSEQTLSNGGHAGHIGHDDSCHTSNGCNTANYVEQANADQLCGRDDWRLPEINELQNIVAYEHVPTVDTAFFRNAATNRYWSATAASANSGHAWTVNFSSGAIELSNKADTARTRLVAAGDTLRAAAINSGVIYNWDLPDANNHYYSLYIAEESGQGHPFDRWDELKGATILEGVTAPQARLNLENGQPYFATLVVDTREGERLRSNEAAAIPQKADPIPSSPTGKLNDTGVSFGGHYPNGNSSGCSGEEIEQQDCRIGRDADATGNSDVNGLAGFNFDKLDDNGSALPFDAEQWSCIRDRVTGLIWEVKTAAGSRSNNDSYTWYNPNANTNGGLSGEENTNQNCNAGFNCNTNAYVERQKSQQYCGKSNWRLPTLPELQGIVAYDRSPSIDQAFFLHSSSNRYWSATPAAFNDGHAWVVSFADGTLTLNNKSDTNRIRLVSNP